MNEPEDPELLRGELIRIGELLTAAGVAKADDKGQALSEAKRLELLLTKLRPKPYSVC